MCGGGGYTPQPVVEPPKSSDSEVAAAAAKERELARLRKGRASTILTSFTGLGEMGKGKTLLGQ